MKTYGIRVRRKTGAPLRRVRTLRNPKGVWGKVGATFVLNVLRARGFRGHIFEIQQAVNYPTATHYSEHFSRKELNCKCGCTPSPSVVRELTILAKNLELMRDILGPIGVLSGHRCRRRNDAVGGALNSQHLYGTAADLLVEDGQQATYTAAAMKVPDFEQGGIGVYPNGGVHVDHRGYKARWNSWSRS